MTHAREVFQDAEKYDEVYDCIMVTKAKANEDLICNPIYKFTEDDVWRYIRENEIEVNHLYEMGYKRVGCVICPLGGRGSMIREAADFPKYKHNYLRAFDRMLKARRAAGKDDIKDRKDYHRWETAEDVYEWWIRNYDVMPKGQMTMDDLMAGGSDSVFPESEREV